MAARDMLLSTAHGGKAEVTQRAAALLGCSAATLYRKLEAAGLDTGRKRRSDAGSSEMTLAELEMVSGVLWATRRDNDKQLWSAERAIDNLKANGQLPNALSPSRVLTLLRARNLHPEQLAQPKPTVQMASLHPNHVWQIDSSTSVLYKDKTGRMRSMASDEFYKNKPANFAKVMNDLITRYLAVDHASGAFKGRYYLGGESAENLIDFFIWAVSKQDASPLHGVPRMVYMDRGPGNRSGLWLNFARRLEVRVEHHAAGVANATGSVEKHGDIWERHVEGGFKFVDPELLTLDFINGMGEEWAAAYCSNKRHSRHGKPRYSMWMGITTEQLRVPVSVALLRELVNHEPEPRRVSNNKTISMQVKGFGVREYDVALVPGIAVGAKVMVCLNAYRAPAIDVRAVDADTGEETWHTVAPLQTNELGFRTDAPVFGEGYRRAANTVVDEARNTVQRNAYRTGDGLPTLEEAAKARKQHVQAYAGIVDPMADVRAIPVPTYMPRKGTPLDAPTPRQVEAARMGVVDACKRLKATLGEAYTPQVYGWVAQRFPDGVPEDQLDTIAAQFGAPAAASAPRDSEGGLRAVGG